ncbi:MAG TPA: SRPBCC domain-containing protein [Methanoregulaceae archaeon]|jgi:uncharacterized protein YndB with AHSA1/START domain|nr:SRPBCC domain-containing protein [Methanoregulaceae archaeon]HOH81595.1 SRPBCC domain-containing protein [Methanoregulaceae archaeon]HPW09662.1 SRPBCC domain-containing protein [Methanoregulaceae archaeon]
MQKTMTKRKSAGLSITRVFDAPVDLVWKAWTDPGYVKRWWGPKDFTAPFIMIDFRVGGTSLLCMRSPDGQEFWSTGIYREIVPEKRIVTTDSFSDEKGAIVPASFYGMTGVWPLELLVTLTFEEKNGKTTFTLVHEGMPPGEPSEQAKAGWNESLDKLETLLHDETQHREKNVLVIEPGKPASLTRIFDAPPERLFSAVTDPARIPLWWGPGNLTTIVDTMDARSGGSWRFIQRDADGNEYAFHGVYHEVSPRRIVQTLEFEGMPGHVQLEVITFEEVDGKTKMVDKSVIETPEDVEDEMLKSAMAEGWMETIDRLAELVEKKWREG